MRTSRVAVYGSVLNLIVFMIIWVWKSLSQTAAAGWGGTLYVIFGLIGLLLAVYGFVTLAKGGENNVKPAGVLILLTFIPGCAVLIEILRLVGGHPVG